jgi:hypothetical protein
MSTSGRRRHHQLADTAKLLNLLANPPAAVLEISYTLGDTLAAIPDRINTPSIS